MGPGGWFWTILLSQLLLQVLRYKKNCCPCSQGFYISSFTMNSANNVKNTYSPNFLVHGVSLHLCNGWCLPQWVLERVLEVLHAAQMLLSCNRRMTKLGWKCFLLNSKTEKYFFGYFYLGIKWKKKFFLWSSFKYEALLFVSSVFLPLFFPAHYFSAHEQQSWTYMCNYGEFPFLYLQGCRAAYQFTNSTSSDLMKGIAICKAVILLLWLP